MKRMVKLKSVAKIITSGMTPLRSEMKFWENGTIPWLKTEQLGEREIYDTFEKITEYALQNTSIKLLPKDAISIAMYGEGKTRGNVSVLKTEMTTNQACCNIVLDNEKADFEYVYYYLKTQYENLRALASGVRKNLNSNDIKEFEINLPKEIRTQQEIVKVLSSLDAKIELNNRINAELEAMAKTIYDYWFVQFDFPDKNGKPYKSSGGKMEWNDELKREVTEGWEVGNLFDIAELIRGVSYDKSQIRSEYDKDVIPILRATNITKNIIDLNQMVFVPSSVVGENQILNLYDILITMSSGSVDHIGKNAFYFYNRKVSYGAFCAKLVAKKDFIFYLYSYMQSEFLSSTLKNECLGTNINNLNSSMVYGFKVVLPNNLMILKFNNIVACYYKMMGNNLNQNQQLASLRDWLLPMLMNGQVSVGED